MMSVHFSDRKKKTEKEEIMERLDLHGTNKKQVIKYYLYDSKKTGVSTLYNLGNTCFFNSVVQCLAHCTKLKEFILQGQYGNEDTLFHEFARLLKIMWRNDYKLTPHSFYDIFAMRFKKTDHDQEDAEEVLLFLLDQFHNALKYQVEYDDLNGDDPLIKQSLDELSTEMSPINDTFVGQFHQRVMCENCRHINHRFESFMNLQLQIPSSKGSGYLSIYNLLHRYCTKEILDEYKCDNCNGVHRAFKVVKLWRLPNTLIISLVRFDWEGKKNSRFVDYPIENLNLTKYCSYPDTDEILYDLQGIISHIGNVSGGHYWSINKASEKWVVLDDSEVKNIARMDDIIIGGAGVGATAYVLFYQKK